MEKHHNKCRKPNKSKHKLRPLPSTIHNKNISESPTKRKERRPLYKPCDERQHSDLNYELWNTIPTDTENQQNKHNIIKRLL